MSDKKGNEKEDGIVIPNENSEDKANRKKIKRIKIIYAFALVIAIGAALSVKIATEKTLGSINAPIEYKYTENTDIREPELTQQADEVRRNVTDVPDTRTEPAAENGADKETTTAAEIKTDFAEPYKGYFALPMGTAISRDYSPDKPTYFATMNDWRVHNGIDFSGETGSAVKAISYGVVSEIYEDRLFGTVVLIDHGNEVLAKYCGFNRDTLEVKVGDTVKTGTLLGYLGTVPCEKSEIAHLHFEISYNGENVEPLELMGK